MSHISLDDFPQQVQDLVAKRDNLRKEKKWLESDIVRKEIEQLGYNVKDTVGNSIFEKNDSTAERVNSNKQGKIALFGSGEMSPTGRKIHEYLFQSLGVIPINVSILATPAGFQSNAYNVVKDISNFLADSLQNYKPNIDIIPAYFKDQQSNRYTPSDGLSTNDPEVVKRLSASDYIFVGPGSPTYALSELLGSKTYEQMVQSQREGAVLSMASAATIAFSSYILPVYEIYKAGFPLEWKKGLNFFEQFGLNLTIVPHWNNNEGGAKHDTSRCYMGVERFAKLLTFLPGETTIVGIDEHTAFILDPEKGECQVMGIGEVTIVGKQSTRVHVGEKISLDTLR